MPLPSVSGIASRDRSSDPDLDLAADLLGLHRFLKLFFAP